ncbi:arsenate reductase family protein [Flexithrix dorotheae]|uniref:arsenate reductase family protein n=1 Tax=Flexithrix dorotheae TaxID=70993 RepID=UPI00036523C2|nr:ArsC/Spx/MgsR family protein [Flexithrix dorotheae]
MRKIYHLSTCNTCQRIIKEVKPGDEFIMQDIKTEKITEEQLEEMAGLAGSYEALFSRVARKYKALNLKEKQLSEEDYKNYILDEYTFLKRPVFIIDGKIFIGNSKKNIEAVKQELS